jgi:hypothetical protein
MQKTKSRFTRPQAIAILAGFLATVGVIIWIISGLLGPQAPTDVSAARLPCPNSDTVRPFGNQVLYYDGASLHCMSDSGSVRWSFPLGMDAGFDCTNDMITAWCGSTLYILDQNGLSTFNDNMGLPVQFARIGSQYVGAVLGEDSSPMLKVMDHTGAHMDDETEAYKKQILLDVGFYGANGEYMWSLALDVYGTVANTTLNTFEVGKMNTGEVALGEPITYAVLFENGRLRVINTRKMHTFNERGSEDSAQSVLVYGWHYLGSEIPARGDALMLFAPTSQADSMYDLRELRLISGSTDKRYSLPDTCIGATLWSKNVFAISPTTLYRAGQSDSRFTTYELPISGKATQLLGTLTNGKAIIACGDEVYVISLPLGSAVKK